MKKILLNILLRIFDLTDIYFDKKVGNIILNYHDISNNGKNYSISRKNFIKQIEYLKIKYSIKDIYGFFSRTESRESKKGWALLHFDDALKSILTVEKYLNDNNVKPVVFVNPSLIGKSFNDMPVLNLSSLKKMVNNKWSMGCHGKNHKMLTKIHNNKILMNEIDNMPLSKKLGYKVDCFSYPYGKYDKKIVKIVKQFEYKYGFTTQAKSFNLRDFHRYQIPRINIKNSDDILTFKMKISPTCRYIKNALTII